jgi:hypothetical protein
MQDIQLEKIWGEYKRIRFGIIPSYDLDEKLVTEGK